MAPLNKTQLNTLIYGKVPPQATELEQAVIGACLLEREAFETVHELLKPEMFYVDAHQKIYAAMVQLFNQHRPIDLLTVAEQLNKTAELEIVGGRYALTLLTQSVNSSAHVQTHSLIIIEKFNSREIIRICGKAIADAYDDNQDVFDLIADTEKQIQAITEGNSISEFVAIGETYTEMLMDIEEMKDRPQGLTGIDTGYEEINSMTDGWQPGNLIVLAARPSVGKTALALNFALKGMVPTLIFSLEAGKKELVKRFAAMKTGVFFSAVKKADLTDYQSQKLIEYASFFYSLPIEIDDKTQSLDRIVAAIRRKVKKNKIKIVYIDYLQLIRANRDKNGNREQEIATITRTLKLLASELEISIVALAQLNREVEKTTTKRPTLSNLRESGAVEQDANIVMMIWPNQISEEETKHIVCIVKNRDGQCGDVELKFSGDLMLWETPTPTTRPPDNPRAGFQHLRNPLPPEDDAPF